LNLTNYYDHPGDNRYTVYRFFIEEHADYFQSLLEEQQIVFERHIEVDEGQDKILFGVNKRFGKQALNCNFMTHAKYRNPFIPNKVLKYGLVIFTLAIIILGILGYINSIQQQ